MRRFVSWLVCLSLVNSLNLTTTALASGNGSGGGVGLPAINQMQMVDKINMEVEIDQNQVDNATEGATAVSVEKASKLIDFSKLEGISIFYLLFIIHVLAGAAMPMMCRNALAVAAAGPYSLLMPLISPDNFLFALTSIIFLFFETLLFQSNKHKNEELEKQFAKEIDEATESGKPLELLGLEQTVESLTVQVDALEMRANAVRATKAGYNLSALVSIAGPIAAAGAGAIIGAIVGACVEGVGAAVGAPVGGAAGLALAAAPDICGPVGVLMLPFLGKEVIDKYWKEHNEENPPGKEKEQTTMYRMFNPGKQVVQLSNLKYALANAGNYEQATALIIEGRRFQAGGIRSISLDQYREIQKADKRVIPDEQRDYFNNLKRSFLAFMSMDAYAKDDREQMEEGILEGVGGDVNALVESTVTFTELLKEGTWADGGDKTFLEKAGDMVTSMMEPDFYKKFTNHLGFKEGGENAFYLLFAMLGDLVVYKFRSYLLHPLNFIITPIEGNPIGKLVSSLVASFLADKVYYEVLEDIEEQKGKIEEVKQLIEDFKKRTSGNAGTSFSSNSEASSSNGVVTNPLEVDKRQCVQNGELSPASIGPCTSNSVVDGAFTTRFNSGFTKIGAVMGGATQAGLDSMGKAFDSLSDGDVTEAQGDMNNLADGAAAMSKQLKDKLLQLDKENPKSRLMDVLKMARKGYLNNMVQTIKRAKINPKRLLGDNQPMPMLASINMGSNKQNTQQKKKQEIVKVERIESGQGGGGLKLDMGRSSGRRRHLGQGIADNVDREDKEHDMAMKTEFNINDINTNKGISIFVLLSRRYVKSAFPRLLTRKKK
jgi:hypothetical protein